MLLASTQRKGTVALAFWVVGLLVFAAVLSATVRSAGSALLLGVGSLAIASAVVAQLADVRPIARYRALFVGFVAAFFAVLLGGVSLLTGAAAFSILGFGASMLAGVAAVLA